jgi:hypothetical protein
MDKDFEYQWKDKILPMLNMKLCHSGVDPESLKMLCHNIFMYGQIFELKKFNGANITVENRG